MKVFLTSIGLLLSFMVLGQTKLKDGVILRVNNRDVSTEEFKNVYAKNASIIPDEDKMNVDEYFELFKKYQLKLEAAYQLNLDEDPTFQKEYQKYYKQLADSYIANGEVTEKMARETYNRLLNVVKASHILIGVQPNASQEDLDKAYEKAVQVKQELQDGGNFESLARQYSTDPSVQSNGGNLGWFKAFKMVYAFEDAAYNLEVGEISEPVKTQFGYHIIKKTDQKNDVGKMKVAHIMIRIQQSDTTSTPKSRIEEIYNTISEGGDFHDLAKQFSQDENTASKGGEMSPFEIGDINSQKFEEVAFSLTEDGQISEPFQTRFGWHIVKRLGTEALPSFEEQKVMLTKKIKTSDRHKMLNSRIQEKIENQYQVTENNDALAYLNSVIDESIVKNKWELSEETQIPEKVFLQIDETSFSWEDLAYFIEKQQRAGKRRVAGRAIVEELADNFVYSNLVEYHKKNLPTLDEEFAATVEEYKSGLLLYEIMEREIWTPAKEDSLALNDFYANHISKYKTEEAIDVEIVSFKKKKQAKEFLKVLDSETDFSSAASASSDAIYQEKETKKVASSSIAEKLKFQTGVSKIYKHNGQYLIYNIHEVKPVRQLEFEEVKGRVISDYQNQLEEEWIASLNTKFELVVNEAEYEKIASEFE